MAAEDLAENISNNGQGFPLLKSLDNEDQAEFLVCHLRYQGLSAEETRHLKQAILKQLMNPLEPSKQEARELMRPFMLDGQSPENYLSVAQGWIRMDEYSQARFAQKLDETRVQAAALFNKFQTCLSEPVRKAYPAAEEALLTEVYVKASSL